MTMRALLTLVLCSVLASPAISAAETEGWRLRLEAFRLEPSDSPTIVDDPGVTIRTNKDTGTGGGIAAEYRFGPRLGLDLSALGAAHGEFRVVITDPTAEARVSDSLTVGLLVVGLNIHLAPDSRTDVYIGPVLAYMSYSNLNVGLRPPGPPIGNFPSTVNVNVGDDVGIGAHFGLGLPFGESDWFFALTARYLLASMDATIAGGVTESVDFDPLLLGIGFGYRF